MEAILKKLVDRLKNDSNLIILFGSYAWGKPDENSDIDLYIVTKDKTVPKNWDEKSKITRSLYRKIYDLQASIPIDLLIHTEGMHKKFLASQSSFAKKLTKEGKVLWRAPSHSSGSKPLGMTSK